MELTEREKQLMNWARDPGQDSFRRRMLRGVGAATFLFAFYAVERAYNILTQAGPLRQQVVLLMASSVLLGMGIYCIYATARDLRFVNVIRFLTKEPPQDP